MFGAIWDLDGTLVNTENAHYQAWKVLSEEQGRTLTFEQFRPTFGLRNDDILVRHLGFRGTPDEIQVLSRRKEDLFRAAVEKNGVEMQPGAEELVQHLHALQAPQVIASSAPPANIASLMALTGLQPYFTAVVSGEDVVRGKPEPDIIVAAAATIGISPNRAVVFEDAPAGVQAGKAAGSKTVAIACAFSAAALSQADLIVRSFTEVLWDEDGWQRFLGLG